MRLTTDSTNYRQLRWVLYLLLASIAAIPSATWIASRAEATAKGAHAAVDSLQSRPVVAPGRIQPKDGVLTIAAPASPTGPAIVTALHVREGDWVNRGQILATLQGREELEAALTSSERRLAIAQAKLTAMKSGGKEDDIKALRAEIQSEEASLAQLEADTHRAKQLHDERILSAAAMEAQQARLAAATRMLEAKRSRLNALSSVRPADVLVAQAELRAVEADVDEARAKLESTVVRAPSDGRVLAIYAHPGQSAAAEGVLAFGRTAEMFVDAEVMEEDLTRTRVGQPARITGAALSAAATGTVEQIGYLVGSREVFKNDPTAFADSRVVHVKIRLAEPASLERFINARVTVELKP